MKGAKSQQIRDNISKKKDEIDKLIQQMKESFAEIGRELKSELAESNLELNFHREELSEILGFEDNVKGFDLEFMTDDTIDFLDIYSQFLG